MAGARRRRACSRSACDRGGEGRRTRCLRPRSSFSSSGAAAVADRRRPGPCRWRCFPAGRAPSRACAVGSGRSPPAETSSGARTGAAISTAAATAPCQSSSSTRVTAVGSLRDFGRGEDGERDAGRGGRRVRAADPGRVVGREGGIAELFGRLGGRGLLFLGGRFGRGLGRRRRRFFRRACSSRRHRARRRRGRRARPATRPPIAFSAAGTGLRCAWRDGRRSALTASAGVVASAALGRLVGFGAARAPAGRR